MDYGFAHEGKVYTPNGTTGIPVDENAARNEAIGAAEMAHWMIAPDVFGMAYFHFPTEVAPVLDQANRRQWKRSYWPNLSGAHVSTWIGGKLGTIISARVYTHNFGGRFVSLRVRGTNGAEYYGRASWDWGQCVTLRKVKGGTR